MKKITTFILASSILSLSVLNTGCYGSFPLTKMVYKFNGQIDNKFGKQILFWVFCILPVYAIGGIGDIFIFNLIQFWTGSNPLSSVEGEKSQLMTDGANTYDVKATSDRLSVNCIAGPNKGQSFDLLFNKDSNTYFLSQNSTVRPLIKIADSNTAYLYLPNGKTQVMKSSQLNQDQMLQFVKEAI